jgi:hypothetical protein
MQNFILFTQFFLGDIHLLEMRLLETGFLIPFQANLQIRSVVFDICQKKKIFSKEIKK